jgi:hypothetical protein
MRPNLPLDQMSTEDKILTIEALWDSLCRDPDAIESPDWHGEVLADRLDALDRGEVQLEDLEAVKRTIRRQIR